MEPVNKDQYLLQSLDNALGVLSLFLQEDKLTLSQIAQRSGLNKTVAYRIVYTLEKRGYLNADREGRYRPGIQLAALGARAQMSRAAVELAKPVLTALSREINETIHFTRRYDACRATLLDEILPQQGLIAASSPTRSLLLLHLCCTGLAILSTQTDEDIRDYCDAVVFEKRSCPFILSSSQLMRSAGKGICSTTRCMSPALPRSACRSLRSRGKAQSMPSVSPARRNASSRRRIGSWSICEMPHGS